MKFKLNSVHLILLLTFLFGFIKFTMQFYLPILYVDLGFDPIQIGFLVSLSFLTHLFLSAPIGILCDKYDIRKIVFISLVFWMIFFFGMLNFSDIFIITFLVIFFRAANRISQSSLDNLMLKFKYKTKNILIGNYASSTLFGVMFGMLLGGVILSQLSFDGLFLLMTGLLIILLPLTYFLPKIKPSRIKLKEYVADLSNKKFLVISIVLFLYALHFGAEHISYGLFLKEDLGLDFSGMGLYMAIAIFFMAIAGLFFGRITKKSNTFLLFGLSLFLSGFGHIMMTQGDILFSLLFRSIHEIGDVLQTVSLFVFLKDTFSSKRVGGNFGVFLTVITLGSIVGSFLFSSIGFDYGHGWSLIISGAVSILASLILFSFYSLVKSR